MPWSNQGGGGGDGGRKGGGPWSQGPWGSGGGGGKSRPISMKSCAGDRTECAK